MVVEEAIERRVAAERDQDRETRQRDRPHARRAEQQERGNRERHRDHAHVGVGIVGEGHAAPVGRPTEAGPAGHHDRGQLPGTERPGGGVLHSHAAIRAAAADRVLSVFAERQVVDARDAERDRHGSEHRDGAGPARRGRRWRAGVRRGQQGGEHHVETHREPRIEGDLRVPAQHLEASGQRQPAEMMEPAASHPARRQPEQQRNVRRPHQLAAVAVRADGDQIRREEKGDAAEQRPLGPRAMLAREQIEEEPAEEVIEQEPRHLGQRNDFLHQRERPIGRINQRVVRAAAEGRHAEENEGIPQRIDVVLIERLLPYTHEAHGSGGVRRHERLPFQRHLMEEEDREDRERHRHPGNVQREARRGGRDGLSWLAAARLHRGGNPRVGGVRS